MSTDKLTLMDANSFNSPDLFSRDSRDSKQHGTDKNDTLKGSKGNDKLDGGKGNDKLVGGEGNDQLTGGSGNDKLTGGKGNDRLIGGEGNDYLDGGSGNNLLTGGKGKDTFVLHRGSGVDTIRDFKIGEDHMKLGAGIGFQSLTFTQRGRDTLVNLGSDQLAVLKGIRSDQITSNDFTK